MLQPIDPASRALANCGSECRRRARVRLSAAHLPPRQQRSSAYAPKVEKPELVDTVAETVKGLANAQAEAAGAAGEAVELGVELGDFRGRGSWVELGDSGGRGSWVELGDSGGRGSWAELSELDVLGGWRSWDLRAGTPHDYWWL